MNARSLIFPPFPAISTPRIGVPSKRALFNLAQLTMVMGYLSLIFNPLDGDAMLLGLVCQAVALTLYVFSRDGATAPSSS